MKYLDQFIFPSKDDEFEFFNNLKEKCYTNFYPFQTISNHQPLKLDFGSVTILYGSNGSGKSTALNVIAEKLKLKRDSNFNKSSFYDHYTEMCDYRVEEGISLDSRIITSDDVFDYALSIRDMNDGIDHKRESIYGEYLSSKHADFQMQSLDDYEKLKKINEARSKTKSRYIRDNLVNNFRTYSNGENAYKYFTEKIKQDALYLLDEPENSLAPNLQLELKRFLEESVKYFGCQIIMATHSPFLLSIEGAQIYDMDGAGVGIKSWSDLENVKAYYNLFELYKDEFKK